jgi:nicotinamidase/pyrazinamidase
MKALILVDIQNDFCPGGALAVPAGDEVVAVANALIPRFDLVVATQDWHPPDHASFASQHPGRNAGEVIELHGQPQVLWPDHCVRSTPGAQFHPQLRTDGIARVFRKGEDREIDSYSGFFDNDHRRATGLGEYLKEKNVEQVFVCGLATDYCVKFTALDARRLGFDTSVVEDACRGVNLRDGDSEAALRALAEAGAEIVQSAEVTG